MSDYILTCCSTTDMPKQFFEDREIPFVCFHFTMDGVTYPDDLGQSMPFVEFYNRLANGSESITSQVNVEEYKQFFEPFCKKGWMFCTSALLPGFPARITPPSSPGMNC